MSRLDRGDALVTFAVVLVAAITPVRIAATGGSWSTAAVLAAQCAAVLLRHRQPVVAWAVTAVGVVLVDQDDPLWVAAGALCQLALLHAVSVTERRTWIAAAVLTALAFHAPLVMGSSAGRLEPGLLAWTVGAVAIGHAIRSRRDYLAAVEDRARRAEQMREAVARRRVVEERLRIARELHDVVGHHLAVITVHAGLARRTLRGDPGRSEAALVETETAARVVLREMATILRLLRSDDTDDHPDSGPAPGLDRVTDLVEAVRRGGVEVLAEVDVAGVDAAEVPDLVSLTAYRVVQEALTNAARHGAGRVELDVRVAADVVAISVVNRTAGGTHVTGGGYGLVGMSERVDAAGGTLEAGEDGGFFRVRAILPLEPDHEKKGIA